MPVSLIREALIAKASALVHRDHDALAGLIHDDFVYINAGGRVFDKQRYVDAYCRSGHVVFLAQDIVEIDTRLFGEFAVASLMLRDQLVVGGRTTSATYRSLCTLAKTSAGWLWAAGQTMAIAD